MYETLKQRWEQGRISLAMLRIYVRKGLLTAEQFTEITGEVY
ncbi:MAG: XkdX family protein [Clostridiaceae bacterium]|nr:XkdX family protein [Clostridiaceae bacterium]